MMYKQRFENVFRVAKKLTSSLQIGDVLEMIRDEARNSIPHLREACLLVIDPEAEQYTRPLHCAVEKRRINCQLCKRGRRTISLALEKRASAMCFLPSKREDGAPIEAVVPEGISEIVVPIYQHEKPAAVLQAIAAEGETLNGKDLVVLQDLAEIAANVIDNAQWHWKMAQEKMTVDSMLKHLKPFVPSTVQKIVEKNPIAPGLEKKDAEVSVLFLDVAGYTKISETQTREKVNFIIEKYFSAFLDIINAYAGDINETAGDGLMVIFQGDSQEAATNAVLAAHAIREKTEEINKELKSRFPPVKVNMGINSGIASVGMNKFEGVTGTRMTFTATGPITNLAARIASAAKDGDILVGPKTAEYVNNQVKLQDRGFMEFKNVREPVQVFSLLVNDSPGVGSVQ